MKELTVVLTQQCYLIKVGMYDIEPLFRHCLLVGERRLLCPLCAAYSL